MWERKGVRWRAAVTNIKSDCGSLRKTKYKIQRSALWKGAVCVFLCTSSPWPSLPQAGQAASPLCAECHLARQAGHVTSSCIGTTGAQWPMPSCFEGRADPTCMCPHKHTETCTHMNITDIFMWHSFYPTDLLLHVFKIKQCLCAAIAEKNINIHVILLLASQNYYLKKGWSWKYWLKKFSL